MSKNIQKVILGDGEIEFVLDKNAFMLKFILIVANISI
jgi:hypothetical protein